MGIAPDSAVIQYRRLHRRRYLFDLRMLNWADCRIGHAVHREPHLTSMRREVRQLATEDDESAEKPKEHVTFAFSLGRNTRNRRDLRLVHQRRAALMLR